MIDLSLLRVAFCAPRRQRISVGMHYKPLKLQNYLVIFLPIAPPSKEKPESNIVTEMIEE